MVPGIQDGVIGGLIWVHRHNRVIAWRPIPHKPVVAMAETRHWGAAPQISYESRLSVAQRLA